MVSSVPSALIIEGQAPKEGTKYSDCPQWMDKTLIANGYGDYIFTLNKNGSGENIDFFFGMPKDRITAAKPFRKYWKKHGNHRWAPILKSLEIIEDRVFPRSSNYTGTDASGATVTGIILGPTYYDRYIFIPECNEGSKFLLEEFLSPFPIPIPTYRVPVATSVQFNIPGLSGGFQEALHGDIAIPDTRSGASITLGSQSFPASGFLSGQFFPKTNFRSWVPYVIYHESQQDESCGLWYGQRIRVFPPLRPKAIRR